MIKITATLLVFALLIALIPAAPAVAGGSETCYSGTFSDGTQYSECITTTTRGNRIVEKGWYADTWWWSAWKWVYNTVTGESKYKSRSGQF